MLNLFRKIGASFLKIFEIIGKMTIFSITPIISFTKRPYYFSIIWRQIVEIGFYSIPVVGMTAIFTGAVLALQSYSGFSRFSAESSIATVVVLSITRELAPVLAGLMVAGRVGASMAAEIATMKVTEQIDALSTLSINPIKYLIAPRVLAAMIALPCLVLLADIIGVMGGYIVAVMKLDFNSTSYIKKTLQYLESSDVYLGLVKALFFGFIISIIGCFFGTNSGRGAQGVGNATTNAVVVSSILILLSNYLITEIFFGK